MAAIKIGKKDLLSLLGGLTENEAIAAIWDLGMPVDAVSADEITVDITPNRPDMYSVEGLARAIASLTKKKPGMRAYKAKESGTSIVVDKSVKKIRPYICAAIAKNVKMDDTLVKSLVALQEKLHDTLGRKRRKVAIGFTDLDKLKPPFVYQAVAPNRHAFIPLEQSEPWTPARILKDLKQGQDYGYILEGHKKFPLIVDSQGTVVALPPIITAEAPKITPSTRNIFIDVTGTSEHSVHDCLKIICCALADRGAEIQSVTIAYAKEKLQTPDLAPLENEISMKRVNGLLGTDFTADQIISYLGRMGHSAGLGMKKNKITVRSPPYRSDILHEADFIEDVAIPHGYNSFELSLPKFVSVGSPSPGEVKAQFLRELMVGFGFSEVLAPYITSRAANFTKPMIGDHPAVHIKNPLNENASMFRSWCTPSLLEILANSKDQKMPQRIFEVGHVATLQDGRPYEERKLAGATCDPKASFNEMRSIVESIAAELGLSIKLNDLNSHPAFIPGRAAEIEVNGKPIGIFGEIHPGVLNNFGIEQPVAAFEMSV